MEFSTLVEVHGIQMRSYLAHCTKSHYGVWVIIKVLGHQYRWLAGGYDLQIGFFKVASMVVTWWIVVFVQ